MKLRVFLPAADRIDEATRMAWILLDARGAPLRSEISPASGMPRASDVELALPASRVLFARLKLPRVNAATIRELLPFAVEDRLLADPAQIHAVAGPKNERGETLVAVVDRGWLVRALEALEAAGLSARTAYCESALLAGGRGDWNVVLDAEHGFLVDDDGVAAAFDRPASGAMPLAIRVALDEAATRVARPQTIRVHARFGAALPDLARWSEESGLAFGPGSQWETLASARLPRSAINLVHGDLAGRRGERTGFAFSRAATGLAAAIVALQLGFTAIDAWRQSSRHADLVGQQEAIFRAAFPEARAVVDPELQMTRNLSELRRSRGLAAEDDFLPQVTRAAREFPAGDVNAIRYENGKLEVLRGPGVAEAKR